MSQSSLASPSLTSDAAPAQAGASRTAEPRRLDATDRCDACGAQARVRVVMASGELLFCGHHARAHMEALKQQALLIQDDAELLA